MTPLINEVTDEVQEDRKTEYHLLRLSLSLRNLAHLLRAGDVTPRTAAAFLEAYGSEIDSAIGRAP